MSTPHSSTPQATAARATSGRLRVGIVTPEGAVFDGEALSVVVPGHDGEVAFFPLHAPYVGALGCGELRIDAGGDRPRRWYLEGGVAEVFDNQVTVLAERVLLVEQLDAAGAQAELDKAVACVPADEPAAAARAALIRSAQARLRLAGRGSSPRAH